MSTPQDEWRALGRGARRVAWKSSRRFRAHPDPVVSAVAAQYARWYLDARTWPGRAQRLAFGLVLADVIAAAVVQGWLSGGPAADRPSALEKTLIWLVAIVILLVIAAPYAVRKVRLIRLYRLELANQLTLDSVASAEAVVVGSAGTQLPAAGWMPTAGQEMTVCYDRRGIVRLGLRTLPIVGFMLVLLVGQELSSPGLTLVFWAVCGFFAVFGLLIIVPYVVLLVRWVLPGRPVVSLDAAGLHLPSLRYELPWGLLAEVRLIPMRFPRRGRRPPTVIAFVPRDPSAVLAALPVSSRRRTRLERSLRVYGTPLSVSDKLIDHSGEQIAAAAATFANVPVRRQ